jgi:DNA mismatch repair protein MutS2
MDDKLNLFEPLASRMVLPYEVRQTFLGAFEEKDGPLSGEKYPHLGIIRKKIDTKKSKIIQTLMALLQSADMRDKLSDTGYAEIDGRYCIMLRNTYKKGVGIVHGSSNTGRSLYVEPMEIVEPSNEMRALQAVLKQEENEIYFQMLKNISYYRTEIRASVKAVAEVDVFCAKARVGLRLGGTVPEVGSEGTVRCRNARHPVLLLRNQMQLNQVL